MGGGASCRWVASPGGTITFQVFDTHRYVIDTYVRTCTTGGERDPNHNMVPDVFETGHCDGQGKQQ
jgi:hypothetical protein